MLLSFSHNNGMAFLENFVDCDQGFKRLHLVCENRLPGGVDQED